MDKEVQDTLIRKCKQVIEDTYPIEDPIKITDIHDLLLKKGIPFNILYKAYHVQEGHYLFYDKSVLLSQLLLMITMSTERAERYPDAKDSVLDHIRKRIDLRCFRVNKDTGYIDVYDYDTGAVLFERRKKTENRSKTNADRIRKMTVEELADIMQGQCACCAYQLTGCTEKECKDGAYEWLIKEEKE